MSSVLTTASVSIILLFARERIPASLLAVAALPMPPRVRVTACSPGFRRTGRVGAVVSNGFSSVQAAAISTRSN
ncbi:MULTISPECIES: hypothetical protein [unclassified Butyricimonas]|uniref:hypothetical protein n=1 Tax=unclassified Butyricimonas TaxID=2637652 RepID=UPI0011458BEF|nr:MULTISPECIES: hypothetical protein [unclassified Butyricimonas]